MNSLFNFQPLFFHNMKKFVKQQDVYNDPSMQEYLNGLGFDRTFNPLANGTETLKDLGFKLPNFLPKYFSRDVEEVLRVPYRLPGVGIPTSELIVSKDQSGLVSLFKKKQGVTIDDVFGLDDEQQSSNLDGMTAKNLIDIARKVLIFASGSRSIWEGEDAELKTKSDSLVAGVKGTDKMGVYEKDYTPQLFDEAASKQAEDLARILPWVNQDQLFDVINFSQMRPTDGSQKVIEYASTAKDGFQKRLRNIAMKPPLQANRREMLVDVVGRQIRLGKRLPTERVHWLESDFRKGNLTHAPRYEYQERERAVSRFS